MLKVTGGMAQAERERERENSPIILVKWPISPFNSRFQPFNNFGSYQTWGNGFKATDYQALKNSEP
jgi:hypothetical protein